MGLTKLEMETIINMNDGEDVAYIYTAQPKVIGRLKRNPAATLVEEGRFERSAWARFTMPARLISFRSVVVRQELTDEEKQRRRDRLARNAGRPGKGSTLVQGVDEEPAAARPGRIPAPRLRSA